jgi:signal transduction histidine kinase/FixJ family two-component response regulator
MNKKVLQGLAEVKEVLNSVTGDNLQIVSCETGIKEIDEIGEATNLAIEEIMNRIEQSNADAGGKLTFLANMSHEIRTPLNGIMGLTELAMTSTNINHLKEEYLKNIHSCSEGLLQIVNNILDFSKIQAGHVEVEIIPTNVSEVIKLAHVIMSPRASEKNLDIKFFVHPKLDCLLLSDSGKLRQVLFNLVSNAIKFTETGSVTIRADIIQEESYGYMVKFEVNDTGIGMTQDQAQQIFKPFEQASAGTSRTYGGTGLGLTISKTIIEALGSELVVESVVGVGTKFSFNLPMEYANKKQVRLAQQDYNSTEKPTFSGLVLVVEDNDMNQKVIRGHLEACGLSVIIANDGQPGLDAYEKLLRERTKPVLIFMDANMPLMSGIEATKKLRAMGCKIPIIIWSAATGTQGLKDFLEYGFEDALSKPFQKEDLWKILRKHIKKPIVDTPVYVLDEDERDPLDRDDVTDELLVDFYKSQKDVIADLKRAMKTNDIQTAHTGWLTR